MPARELLKFSTPRDPAQLAAFINLRVLNPEHEHWRRGIEAATLYLRLHGDLKVPFTYRVPAKDDQEAGAEGWPAALAAFPLGQWIADARRFYARGVMDADRIAQLEKLGMVWSHYDVAWEEGLAAARGWAAEHGHLLAPLDAAYQGYRVGIWLKNARTAARRTAGIEQRCAVGLPVGSSAGALSQERREQLEDIDPSWCPAWPVDWQRAFHLVRQHLRAGGELPAEPGTVVHQGEDLGRWVRSVRLGWDNLTGVQQWMCEHILGLQPVAEAEKPQPRRTQAGKWVMNLAGRPAVLPARRAPAGAQETRRDRRPGRRGGRRQQPGPGTADQARGLDQQSTQQGSGALTRADRATIVHRHAMDLVVSPSRNASAEDFGFRCLV